MHGLIFTSFLDFTTSAFPEHTEAIWQDEPRYLPTQSYPDEQFSALVAKTAGFVELPEADLLRRFGSFAGEVSFARLYPSFYAESRDARTFLLSVEKRIHELVRATVPDAQPPRLHTTPLGERGVAISYTSERGLCALLEGLVLGVASHYGERVELSHPQCMLRGDLACAVFVEPSVA